jgi:hypothetical protein
MPGIASSNLLDRKAGCSAIIATMVRPVASDKP